MKQLRSAKYHETYEKLKLERKGQDHCFLCSTKSIQEFKHWRILLNDFPYDVIASTHHLIVPKIHKTEHLLTEEEREELILLKDTVLDKVYEFVVETLPSQKSIPKHFHLHLMVFKDDF
jgi:diadenosine tetraphosphate (Ap4A) HIT family hydrolase